MSDMSATLYKYVIKEITSHKYLKVCVYCLFYDLQECLCSELLVRGSDLELVLLKKKKNHKCGGVFASFNLEAMKCNR